MNHLLNVETERLCIRPYSKHDLDKSFKLMQESSGETVTHLKPQKQ